MSNKLCAKKRGKGVSSDQANGLTYPNSHSITETAPANRGGREGVSNSKIGLKFLSI